MRIAPKEMAQNGASLLVSELHNSPFKIKL